MREIRVLICPACGQGHPWSGLAPDDLGRLEDWTDCVHYSPTVGFSVEHIGTQTRMNLLIPRLRACVRCGLPFRINPTAPLNPDQAAAQTPAGSAGPEHYLEFLNRAGSIPETEDILLEGWVRSNDLVRRGQLEEIHNPHRISILRQVVGRLQNQGGIARVRAAEAAREMGDFNLAVSLLNCQFAPLLKFLADFIRDLALLGDVLVRQVATYPDIVAFEKAKARAAEDAVQLKRAQEQWAQEKAAIGSKHAGLGGVGCLCLLAAALGAGFLGQLLPLVIVLGVVFLLVFTVVSSKDSAKAKEWEESHSKPDWPIHTPTFSARPPVLSIEAVPPSAAKAVTVAPLERAAQPRAATGPKPSPVIEAVTSEWNDPALSEIAEKVKSRIESSSALLEVFLVETEKATLIRQSFVKHQIFAFLFIFTLEFKSRHSFLYIGYQNQLIREIRSRMPLLNYSTEHLIEEFHAFEAMLADLTQERAMKFFFDLTKEKGDSAPSIPGFLSHLVCEEAQIGDDPAANNVLFGLFNGLIESSQNEHPFDEILDDFVDRVRLRN
jgi:hypothetical protein